MWVELEQDEFEIIDALLANANLHGIRSLLLQNKNSICPYNPKLTNQAAISAAQTYFSADDLTINEDYVKWDKSGNAEVLAWQKVPIEYIKEEDCGCGK